MKRLGICFTEKGAEIAKKIQKDLEIQFFIKSKFVEIPGMLPVEGSLRDWCKKYWNRAEGIVIIGSTGIAVRMIAEFVEDKFKDPAVIVVDDTGTFCISLLSGHVGGANELTDQIAQSIEGIPVITTSTDRNRVFSIDVFAKKMNYPLPDREIAKDISAKLLQKLPVVTLGIGCKKEVPMEIIFKRVKEDLDRLQIPMECIKEVASIDRKADEKGILEFCKEMQVPFYTYSAEELMEVKGEFTVSNFVHSIVQVDTVCERSAVLSSNNGMLVSKKTTGSGVTVAVAIQTSR